MRASRRVAAFALMVVTVGCGHRESDGPVSNVAPYVTLTGGPREGNRTNYKARVFWSGWDDDGTIDHYEYAIDPPSVFTSTEIAFPETSPGVVVTAVSAKRLGEPDTVRVTKVVDEVPYRFDYVKTSLTDHVFVVSATTTDSTYVGGRLLPSVTSSDVHTVHVRAMDNEGAYSAPDHLGFTAWTYTPTSWITFPDVHREILSTGQNVIIEWGGTDPDPPPRAQERPVGYLYKLIDVETLDPPLNLALIQDAQRTVFEEAAHIPWTYKSADTLGVTLEVRPGSYLFALRAVDAAGGVEPFIEWRRDEDPPGNAFLLRVTEGGGRPILNVTEPFLGAFEYRGPVKYFEVEVPVGTPLRFEWSASAEDYGGRIEAYSYGLDIADLDQEGPGSGWSPWGLGFSTTEPIVFKRAGLHVFYVRVRDSGGNITRGAVIMRVFDLIFDREVLFIDDFLDRDLPPLDREHDDFWNEMFVNSGRFDERDLRTENLWYEVGGDGDKGFLNPAAPPLSFLGHYRLLVWSVHGAGYCNRTGLFADATMSQQLGSYLSAGGKLWLTGKQTLSPLLQGIECPDPNSPFYNPDRDPPPLPGAETTFPHSYAPGDFAWDFLKLFTLRAENDKGTDWWNTLERVDAWNRTDPIFQDMQADPEKVGTFVWETTAINHCDAIFEPILTSSVPGFKGELDSLYAYVAAGPFRRPNDPRTVSNYDGRLCATRWHDPDPDRAQGRVMWFGFPLYYMMQSQAQETFNRAIDWFNEETLAPREEDLLVQPRGKRGEIRLEPSRASGENR